MMNYSQPAKNSVFYISGNFMAGQGGYPDDPYSLPAGPFAALDSPARVEPVTTHDALTARDIVLKSAGALPWNRDAVDRRLVREVRTDTGKIIASPDEVGGWPTLHSLPYPADDDNDGMPDYWEHQYGSNANDASDNNDDADGDGYTNIEEYLNNTDPTGGSAPILCIGATDSRVVEGERSPWAFTVFRIGDTSTSLVVKYMVRRSATAAEDYAALSGSVGMPRGAPSASFCLTSLADDLVEKPEQIIVSLCPSSGYRLGLPRAALAVIEDQRR